MVTPAQPDVEVKHIGGRGVTPERAAQLRRIAHRWLRSATALTIAFSAVRLAAGGAAVQEWEPAVAATAIGTLALGMATALRWEGFAGAWFGLVGVAGGISVAAHFGPVAGIVPVLALMPPAVMLVLAWQHIRSARAVAVFGAFVVVVLAVGALGARAAYDAVFGPTHPESTTAVPGGDVVEWMWAGETSSTGFTVVAGVQPSSRAHLLVAGSPDGPWQAMAEAPADDGVVRLRVSDLDAATTYHYAVETDRGRSPTGHIRTFPIGPADMTIAFSSCARTGSNGAVFDAIRDLDPDLYVVTGDLFYGDIGPADPDAFSAAYVEALTQPAQAALYRAVPIAYVWDDHDFSRNDADAQAPSRPAAMAVYRRLVPHYPLRGDAAPIYQAFTIGRVRVVMTDTRSARDPAEGTVLGPEQLQWFAAELAAAADAGLVVLWVNPDPWIATAEPGADHWGGFAGERARLAETIASLDLPGLLMLSGDAHMVAIDDGTNNTYAAGLPGFPVFHAGALDRPGSVKGGPYSEGAHPGGGQFGVVEIRDDGRQIELRLTGLDWEGNELVSATFVVPEGALG